MPRCRQQQSSCSKRVHQSTATTAAAAFRMPPGTSRWRRENRKGNNLEDVVDIKTAMSKSTLKLACTEEMLPHKGCAREACALTMRYLLLDIDA
eukprot:1157687-Pelagomonas_calceolata.AAC.3